MSFQKKKTAIVTGSSSGIGCAVCRKLLEKGYAVYGFSRRGTAPEGAKAVSVDVSDVKAVFKAAEEAVAEAGRIDLLVNCAGMGISGPAEFALPEDIRRITDVDFLGQVFCAQAVLPAMRRQGSGSIVFVSSVAAAIAIPYQAFYSTAKASVNAFALALRNEMKDFNVKVSVVMPGDATTGFTDARRKDSSHDGVYTHNGTATAAMEKDERNGMTPEYVADAIIRAAEKRNPAPHYTVGGKYKIFMALFKFLPARLSYKIVGKMYS